MFEVQRYIFLMHNALEHETTITAGHQIVSYGETEKQAEQVAAGTCLCLLRLF